MQFTLDSVSHSQACLEKKYLGKKISYEPFYTENLNDLTLKDDNYYFGLISFGSNVINGVLNNSSGDEFFRVVANSQIIELFNSVDCFDGSDVAVATPKGHFRGFKITIR